MGFTCINDNDDLIFLKTFLNELNISQDILRFIGPMAVGFIVTAGYRLGRKIIKNKLTLVLFIFGGIMTYLIREPWIYPAVLLTGGLISLIMTKEKQLFNKVKLDPPWIYLITFGVIALSALGLSLAFDNIIIHLFESFYRYGYLVIGGGQVVVPMMFSELVDVNQYMTSQEF